VVLTAALVLVCILRPTLTAEIRPAQISRDQGQAYSSGPILVARLVGSDSLALPERSRLELLEDGVPLGPAHSQHQRIREVGHGDYSHWAGAVLFSSSDGTDPRTNGRRYIVRVRADVTSRFVLPALALLAILTTMASGLQARSRLGGTFTPFSGRMVVRYGWPLALAGLGGAACAAAWLVSRVSPGLLSTLLLVVGLIASPIGVMLLVCEFVEGDARSRAEGSPDGQESLSRRLGS
jgi:hypothetical protein